MSAIGAMTRWQQPWRVGDVLMRLDARSLNERKVKSAHVEVTGWDGMTQTLHTAHVLTLAGIVESFVCKVEVKS